MLANSIRSMDRETEGLSTSSLNHSCSPNSSQVFATAASDSVRLVALCDIEKGEELSISYIEKGEGTL